MCFTVALILFVALNDCFGSLWFWVFIVCCAPGLCLTVVFAMLLMRVVRMFISFVCFLLCFGLLC